MLAESQEHILKSITRAVAAADSRLLLRDKFIACNSACAKYRVKAEFTKQFKGVNVQKKRNYAMTNGTPSYDEVNTIFQASGVYRNAEAVRGMILLLNSKLFRHPKEFAEVWNEYGKAAEEIVNLSREEVSLIGSSLINSLGGKDKGRAPWPAQGPAGRDRGALLGRAGPEHLQHSVPARSCRQVQGHREERCQVCRSLCGRENISRRGS